MKLLPLFIGVQFLKPLCSDRISSKVLNQLKIPLFREPIQVKDAVLFSPVDKNRLIEVLQIDTYEPPMTQVCFNCRICA